MVKSNYYQELDYLFNNLYEKYGLNEDIICVKQNIIKIIDNLNDYDYKVSNNDITKQLKKRSYKIDENGIIISC